MLQVVAYALAISVALSLAGFCAEKIVTMLGRSRRFFWAATMVLSILWPLGMMLWARPVAVSVSIAAQVVAQQPVAMPMQPAAPVALAMLRGAEPQTVMPVQAQEKWQLRLPSDRTMLLAWAVASGLLLLFLAGTDLLLHYRASRWRRETVLGQQVQISEATGPALLGAMRPQIVVPRWFLDEPAATQSLILEHEQQHIAAHDPLLLRLALLIVALVPWNLPLWWQLRRLRQAIELDCDARVLRTGAEASSYGAVLLAVTQRAGNVPAGALAMGEPVSALEQRITHLTARARYSAPRVLAAAIFWAASIGAAFALQAPALRHSPGSSAMHADAPASSLQPSRGPPSLAIEAPAPALVLPAPRPVLTAAQTSGSPRGNSAQGTARAESAQALPRLLPPIPVPGPAINQDDPRSEQSTRAAVLASRPNLESEFRGEKVLVVFMNGNGKIDRSYVIDDVAQVIWWSDVVFPAVLTNETPAGILPELLAKRWEPLGLRPEQLGQMGLTVFDNKNNPGNENIYVLYAWPRRSGEPLGGFMRDSAGAFGFGSPYRSTFTYSDAVAVVQHYLPGALRDRGSAPAELPWLLLSSQGEVVDSGTAQTAPNKWALAVMERANPGKHIGLVVEMTNQVIFGWLEPDQPAR